MILRPYQLAAVDLAVAELRAGRRVCIAACTGSGKTVMAREVRRRLDCAALATAHRTELVAACESRMGCPAVSVQCRIMPPSGLTIVDEHHHSVSPSYRRHLDGRPGMLLGLTATPYRHDGRGLGAVCDVVINVHWPEGGEPFAVAERAGTLDLAAALMREGVLLEPRTFAWRRPIDVSGIKRIGGDYAKDALAARSDTPQVVGDAIGEYVRHLSGVRAGVSCVTIDHAVHVAAAFNAAGISADWVSGAPRTTADRRASVLADLESGRTLVVAQCNLWGEGVDIPILGGWIMLAPTSSLARHLQNIGRVVRFAVNKARPVILDHAGNTERLQAWATTPIEYSLDGVSRVASRTGLTTCKVCFAIFDSSTLVCPECGDARRMTETQGSLVSLGIGGTERLSEIDATRPPFALMQARWFALDAERVAAGHAVGWSAHRFHEEFGELPIVDDSRRIHDPETQGARFIFFRQALQWATKANKKPAQAGALYKNRFGEWPPFAWMPKGAFAKASRR